MKPAEARPETTGPQSLVLPDDAHDRALVESVHPPRWRNPEPAGRYNLVVLGAGTAGLVSAIGAAGLGAKVALVERHLMGGDCLNVGCVPSKGVLRAARAAAAAREGAAFGVRTGKVEVDFGADIETFTVPLHEVDRAVLDGEPEGFARVHAERRSGRILGATLVAAHAGELIGEMSLAITAGLGLGDVARTIHPYPTQAEAWKRLGDAWNRTRLTRRVRRAFERFLSARR
jgi:pyruvate/2-oxoglutarate dehydrogenase complex dihydrolipoamide dehydrogenase (E3) component